jgi:hypothetical protein
MKIPQLKQRSCFSTRTILLQTKNGITLAFHKVRILQEKQSHIR